MEEMSVKTLEADHRTKLLSTLIKRGLTTKGVESFLCNQMRPGVAKVSEAGDSKISKSLMENKRKKARKEEESFRKMRESDRVALGKIVGQQSTRKY